MTNGLLLIDKESGMTSHDVVSRVRRIFGTKKVGHTGTLDPNATGLLVVLLGEATKLIPYLQDMDKRYEAEIIFGSETDTDDLTGQVTKEAGSLEFGRQELENALESFRGEIDQVPPMYSAKKKDGRKLYEYARKGQEVELEPSRVRIDGLNVLEAGELPNKVVLDVKCSKGTYIRSLARDLGRELGTAAHMGELRRTESGSYILDNAHTLGQIEASENPEDHIVPLESIELLYPKAYVKDKSLKYLKNGNALTEKNLEAPITGFKPGEIVQLYNNGRLLGIGTVKDAEGKPRIQPKRVFSALF